MCPAPAAVDPNVSCLAVVVYAKDPTSGICCQYGSPCVAPSGWQNFYSQAECEKAPRCPAPQTTDAVCPAVVVYAKDPTSGICCQYGDPCRAPSGWKQFNTQADCSK